jgi:hypothetical protein
MIAALDTLQTVKRLKEAAFDDTQAEALTGVLRDTREAEFGQLTTKAAFDRLDANLDRFVAEMRAEFALLRSQIRIFRQDVTLQVGGMIVVATGVLLAAKFFG